MRTDSSHTTLIMTAALTDVLFLEYSTASVIAR